MPFPNPFLIYTVGETDVSTDKAPILRSHGVSKDYPDHLRDESRFGPGCAECLYFPENIQEVSHIVRLANSKGIPITISGGRTGIVGGAVPQGGILISLEKMNKFIDIIRDEATGRVTARAQAGMLLRDFAARARAETKHKYFYPVDPTEDTAQLGGSIATNASGARSYKYGATRRYVRSLKLVLANGELLKIQRGHNMAHGETLRIPWGNASEVRVSSYRMPDVKNTAGYFMAPGMDLIELFIGSEGTLGIICEAELELVSAPEEIIMAMSFFPSEDQAVAFVKMARNDGRVDPLSLEYFDSKTLELLRDNENIPSFPGWAQGAILFEEGCSQENIEDIYMSWEELLQACGSSMEDTWGGIDQRSSELIKRVRHAVPEGVNSIIGERKRIYPQIHKMGTDMAVLDEHLEEIVKFYRRRCQEEGLEYVIFGHIGDNHLHVNILPRSLEDMTRAKMLYREFAEEAVALGGTVAAEHGIGKVKKELLEMMYKGRGMEEMLQVKNALDPGWILNRGNVLERGTSEP